MIECIYGENVKTKEAMVVVFKKIVHNPLFWVLVICFGIQIIYYSQVLSYEVCGDTSSYTYEYDPSFRTPVYPLFGGLVRIFTGDEETSWLTTMAIIQRIIMFASIFLFWGLICNITKNKYLRFFATVIYGSSPAIFSWGACILTEAFSIVEIVALMYFTIKYLKEEKKLDALFSGLMVLVLVLTRPATVYLLVVYALFWAIRFILAIRHKKRRSLPSIRIGILGVTIALCGVLGYCFVQKTMFGDFGLSSVSYVNDLLMVIDTDIYKQSTNDDIRDYIVQQKEITQDNYRIIWHGLMKKYSRTELEKFSAEAIHQNHLRYIKELIYKAIRWGTKPMATAYNSLKNGHSFSLKQFVGFLFPVPFSLVYFMLIGMIIWLIIRIVRKRRLDWVLLIIVMLIGGNIGVTIIAAPYEPERLCVTSLPVLIVSFAYISEVVLRYCKGKRIESEFH